MKPIDVAVVDDNEFDRYIVRRRLSRSDVFGEVSEAADGDEFLADMYAEDVCPTLRPPLLVLMDVNMPRKDGFDTVEEIQDRMSAGKGPESIVVMMYTSSDNPSDKSRADELSTVKGYIVKPFDDAAIDQIKHIYQHETRP